MPATTGRRGRPALSRRRCAASASCTTAASTRSSASTTPPCSTAASARSRTPTRSAARSSSSCSFSRPTWPPSSASRLRSTAAGGGRVDLLIQRATAGECDLVVKGVLNNVQRGWLLDKATGKFQSDRTGDAEVIDADLRRQVATAGQELTYTCVPPGSGVRIGIDRDEDGFPDRTEIEQGSDPADPNSVPAGGSTTTTTFPQPPSCTNVPVTDPRAIVKVVTRREAGQLRAKMVIDLAAYMNEDVFVSLSDADTPRIAGQDVGVLPPQGSSGTKWRFLSTAEGVQRVSLRSLGSRQPGKSKLSLKAKRWFTAAAANQPPSRPSSRCRSGTSASRTRRRARSRGRQWKRCAPRVPGWEYTGHPAGCR